MRIGIIVNSSWNIYNFRLGLVDALVAHGHEVVAIAPDDGFVEELKARKCAFYNLDMERKGSNPLQDLFLIWQMYDCYKKAKIDIALHFTIKPNIYGTLAARALGIPSICNVTGLGTVFLRENLTSKIAHWLYRFAFRFPKTIFFQNQDDLNLFLEKKLIRNMSFNLIQKQATNDDVVRFRQRIDLLPGSGIDTERFKPTHASEGRKTSKFTFLLIARLLYDKGILEYVEAIKILKNKGINAQFQLLGKIETDQGLGVTQDQVQVWTEAGLLTYLGTTNEVRTFIQDADCVVLPSYREGTPRTLLEAMSMGKPLIATNVAGCKETIVDGLNGFLCEVKSGEDLAGKIEKMLALSDEQRQEMSKQSRLLAMTKFDQNIVIQKYLQVIG
jgi:glycosyltransferase involved in cell wall biosynthesis